MAHSCCYFPNLKNCTKTQPKSSAASGDAAGVDRAAANQSAHVHGPRKNWSDQFTQQKVQSGLSKRLSGRSASCSKTNSTKKLHFPSGWERWAPPAAAGGGYKGKLEQFHVFCVCCWCFGAVIRVFSSAFTTSSKSSSTGGNELQLGVSVGWLRPPFPGYWTVLPPGKLPPCVLALR